MYTQFDSDIKQELVTGYIWHFPDGSRANCCCLQFSRLWFITTEIATCTVITVFWWTKWSLKNCFMLLLLEYIPQISLFCLFCSTFLKFFLSWHVLQSWSVMVILRMLILLNGGSCVQSLEEAIVLNNSVPQGLSSSILTRNPETIFAWIGFVSYNTQHPLLFI